MVDSAVQCAPEAIAAAALGVGVGAILSVERIKHGLTNDSWRVRTERDAVIVRSSNTSEELLRIDRASEARVLAAVAAAVIGPEVLVCDPDRHVLVTRDLGETWSAGEAHVSGNIERIAQLLRRLHALPVPSGVRDVDLIETMRGYLRSLDQRGRSTNATAKKTRERGESAALALRQGARACLCHNDLHHLNVVDNGSLRLIDWEYSGIGEPMFDLASICVYHGYSRFEREHLLQAYAVHPDATALNRLELACWLFDYIRELWSEVRQEAG
jgi:thiamine kinase-like enzyme